MDIDPEYPTRFLHTVIRVEDELKGSVGAQVTVSTIEAAYAQAPGRLTVSGSATSLDSAPCVGRTDPRGPVERVVL